MRFITKFVWVSVLAVGERYGVVSVEPPPVGDRVKQGDFSEDQVAVVKGSVALANLWFKARVDQDVRNRLVHTMSGLTRAISSGRVKNDAAFYRFAIPVLTSRLFQHLAVNPCKEVLHSWEGIVAHLENSPERHGELESLARDFLVSSCPPKIGMFRALLDPVALPKAPARTWGEYGYVFPRAADDEQTIAGGNEAAKYHTGDIDVVHSDDDVSSVDAGGDDSLETSISLVDDAPRVVRELDGSGSEISESPQRPAPVPVSEARIVDWHNIDRASRLRRVKMASSTKKVEPPASFGSSADDRDE